MYVVNYGDNGIVPNLIDADPATTHSNILEAIQFNPHTEFFDDETPLSHRIRECEARSAQLFRIRLIGEAIIHSLRGGPISPETHRTIQDNQAEILALSDYVDHSLERRTEAEQIRFLETLVNVSITARMSWQIYRVAFIDAQQAAEQN